MLGLASTATQRNSGNIFFSTCLATLLHCKLKLVRITAFMANLSQQNSVTSLRNSTHIIGQSCVITLLLSYNLAFRRTSTSGLHFLLNFPSRRRKRSVFSDNWLGEKLYFCGSFFKPLAFIAACFKVTTRGPKDHESPRGIYTGPIDDFPRVTGLLRNKARRASMSAMFVCFFIIICSVTALRDRQSQGLNSNLLPDKL